MFLLFVRHSAAVACLFLAYLTLLGILRYDANNTATLLRIKKNYKSDVGLS